MVMMQVETARALDLQDYETLPANAVIADLANRIATGDGPENIAVFLDVGGRVIEDKVRLTLHNGDLPGAAALADAAADLLQERESFQLLRILILSLRGMHRQAVELAARLRQRYPDHIWVYYWSAWAAMEAGDQNEAETQIDVGDARFGPTPVLGLARMLMLDRAVRTKELVAFIEDRADVRSTHPDIAFDLLMGGRMSLDPLGSAFGSWLDFPRDQVKVDIRLDVAWRYLRTVLSNPDASPAFAARVSVAVALELIELNDLGGVSVVPRLLIRLSNLFYGNKEKFDAFTNSVAEAALTLDLQRNTAGRILDFLCITRPVIRPSLKADIDGIVDDDEYIPIYFFFLPIWGVDPKAVLDGLEAEVDRSPQARFAAYLYATVFGADRLQAILPRTVLPSVSQDASSTPPSTAEDALNRIASARSDLLARTRSRVPAPQRPLKVAVCVSGQLRGFRAARRTWGALGLDEHDVSYFVHCWRDIGRKSPTELTLDRCFGGAALELAKEFFLANHLGLFTRRYPRLIDALNAAGAVTEAEVAEFYGAEKVVVENDALEPFRDMTNSQKMYYKIEQAHLLAKSTGREFDLIIRIRPDIRFLGGRIDLRYIYEQSAKEGAFFAERVRGMHLEGGVVYSDQLGIGVPEVMDIYAATYTFTRTNGGRTYKAPSTFLPHTTLVWASVYGGLTSEFAPGLEMPDMVGPPPLSSETILQALTADLQDRDPDDFDARFLAACEADCEGPAL